MSVRYSRPLGGRPSLKKNTSSKKKVQARQAWDSTVQDLNVHRATPEELARRHEMHKSKNQRLAHWELQKKSLTKKWKRENGGRVDPLQERRLALMMEILSDQYQMKDVLERSDRAMAVVKDLFGDAPPRHTGFPNVTMAPSCDLETSRGPIVQRKDPPTRLSILSESVMDSQALNEVDDDESEYSDEEDVSMSFQPGLNTDRIHQLLHEERSHPTSHKPPKAADAENPFVTPKSSGHPATNLAALNATEAVKKVKTRLTEEELEEPEGSNCVIGQVLNPNPPNHRRPQRKAKKKRSAPRDHRMEQPLSSTSASDLSCNQSSLEVLNKMIQEVELELEDYDRQAGRQIDSVPRAQGLTGFTLSLVTSIRRLVIHVKEGDRRLHQEAEERQRLQEELHEQRLLIDALTAEILSMKEDPSFSQISHQSSSVPSPPAERLRSPPSPEAQKKKPSPNPFSSQLLSYMADVGLSDAERDLGLLAPPADRVREHAIDSSSLLGFQTAVLLSPPRQRSREELEEQQLSVLKRSLDTSVNTEAKDPPAPRSGRSSSEPCSIKQGVYAKSLASISPQHPHPSPGDSSTPHTDPDTSSIYSLYNDSIADCMAEMTLQNNALKAQLRALGHKLLGDPLPPAQSRGPLQTEDKVTSKMNATPGHSPMTLEQRIAELNRQSAEARNKLLHLIEQQKQSVNISPAISPITPQCDGTEKRGCIEAVIPMPRLTDSYAEETPPPENRSSGRRSSASIRSASSMSSSVRAGGRALVEKRKEEGWFALTAHVS